MCSHICGVCDLMHEGSPHNWQESKDLLLISWCKIPQHTLEVFCNPCLNRVELFRQVGWFYGIADQSVGMCMHVYTVLCKGSKKCWNVRNLFKLYFNCFFLLIYKMQSEQTEQKSKSVYGVTTVWFQFSHLYTFAQSQGFCRIVVRCIKQIQRNRHFLTIDTEVV